jgi:hypothetical protein
MKKLIAQLRAMSLFTLILLAATAAFSQITPLADTYTSSADPTTNYGAQPLLTVDAATSISYIHFNLASVPAGSTIRQATLKLYVNAVTTAGAFQLDAVNGSWTESGLTYSLAPALGTVIDSSVAVPAAAKNQFILIPMTTEVQDWITTPTTNFGVAMVAIGSFNATFDSKESTTTSHAPELDIVFSSGGTLTGVTTASGSGLTGGGTKGTLALSLTESCASGQVLEWNGTAWACATPTGTGTITGVTAGTDLTGGGTSGNVTLNLNTSALNSSYAQLGAANTFTGNETVNGTITATSSGKTILATSTSTTDTASIGIGAVGGVYGSASAAVGFGVYGSGYFGVYGSDNTSAGTGFGVYGVSPGTGTGVVGTSTSGTGVDGSGGPYGVFGQGATGVYGTDDSAGGFGQGISGWSPNGYGVFGSSNNIGVYGKSDVNGGVALFGSGSNGAEGANLDSDTGNALFAQSNSGPGVVAYANANNAVYAQNDDSTGNYPAMLVANETTETHNPVFQTNSPNTYSGSRHCTIDTSANLTCTGVVSGVVQNLSGKQTAIYAMQSAENWLEDAGSGQLSNGSVRIQLDPAFAQTVNAAVEYHVFLTPNGDSKGLYVSNKTATSFEVHEQGGGVSSIAFDYRIMVKRVGYENVRLEDLTERLRQHPLPAQKARPRPMPALRSMAKPIPMPMMATPRPMHPMVAPAPVPALPSAQTGKPEIKQK